MRNFTINEAKTYFEGEHMDDIPFTSPPFHLLLCKPKIVRYFKMLRWLKDSKVDKVLTLDQYLDKQLH